MDFLSDMDFSVATVQSKNTQRIFPMKLNFTRKNQWKINKPKKKKEREGVWQWEKDISNNLWDKDEKTKECLQKKINANKQCKQEKK